jgi:hypothetical protein
VNFCGPNGFGSTVSKADLACYDLAARDTHQYAPIVPVPFHYGGSRGEKGLVWGTAKRFRNFFLWHPDNKVTKAVPWRVSARRVSAKTHQSPGENPTADEQDQY